MLYYAYGITRSNIDTDFPRPFRVVPSGGALYPLELFFQTANVNGLDPGIYHYHAGEHHLRLVRPGDASPLVAEALVQPEFAVDASLLFFIAALFERSTFKYGNRGYRFALLEAGHVAQNVNLVAGALSLGCVNLGGYFDRHVDELLGLNGVTQSAVYVVAVGRDADRDDGGTVG
jgi:SagB-type dehydrogenase family enzyme